MNRTHQFLFFASFILLPPLLNGTGSELKWRKIHIRLLARRPVRVGDSVTFYCRVPGSGAERQAMVRLRGGRSDRTTKWHHARSGVEFRIRHLSRKDEGTYHCEVQSKRTFELNQNRTSVLLRIEETASQGPRQRCFRAVRVALIVFALHLVVLLKRIMTNRRREDGEEPSATVA